MKSIFLLLCVAISAYAAPLASVTVAGTAKSGSRELPAEIRAACADKGLLEVLFAVTFKTIEEAESFFPFNIFEGPDGKHAPMRIRISPASGSAFERNAQSSSGWYGVSNDFLFSLYDAGAWRFIDAVKAADSVEVSIPEAGHRLILTFPHPAAALQKIAKACR